MSFKELCGYGMPISTMFTNGILKADESGTTKIQAPDNAMYNGTSFKTLVAFGLVTEGGVSKPNALAIVGGDRAVMCVLRDASDDYPGSPFPYYWKSAVDYEVYSNTESPEVDSTGELRQLSTREPILGWLKGDGSVYEMTSSTDVPSADMKDNDCVAYNNREYWKVDFNSNPLLVQFVRSSGLDPNMVVSMWIYEYRLINGSIDTLSSLVLYREGDTLAIEFLEQ